MSLRATLPDAYPWESQVRQYPKAGEPGISYFRGDTPHGHVDCLLYRNRRGHVVGILNHYPTTTIWEKAGNVNVWVHPRRQRRGIGSALVTEAAKRWPINFEQQRYTVAGVKLAESVQRKLSD